MAYKNTIWKLSTCTVINNEYNTHNETIHNDNDVTNNEIQEQGQIEDQQPVMDDYNHQPEEQGYFGGDEQFEDDGGGGKVHIF